MNRRNQNFTAPENWRSNRQEDHHGTMYVNRMGTRNNRTNFQSIPRPFPAGPSPFPPVRVTPEYIYIYICQYVLQDNH